MTNNWHQTFLEISICYGFLKLIWLYLIGTPGGSLVHDVDLDSVQKFNGTVVHDEGNATEIVIDVCGRYGDYCRPADLVVRSVVNGLGPLKQKRYR